MLAIPGLNGRFLNNHRSDPNSGTGQVTGLDASFLPVDGMSLSLQYS